MKITLHVKGMACNHCTQMVKAELLEIEGVKDVTASYETGIVEVDEEGVETEIIKQAIESLGYEVEN